MLCRHGWESGGGSFIGSAAPKAVLLINCSHGFSLPSLPPPPTPSFAFVDSELGPWPGFFCRRVSLGSLGSPMLSAPQ